MCVDITSKFGTQLFIVESHSSDAYIYVWLIVYMYKLVYDIFVCAWKGDNEPMGWCNSYETTGSHISLNKIYPVEPPVVVSALQWRHGFIKLTTKVIKVAHQWPFVIGFPGGRENMTASPHHRDSNAESVAMAWCHHGLGWLWKQDSSSHRLSNNMHITSRPRQNVILFWNAFSWIKILNCRINFYRRFFQRMKLTNTSTCMGNPPVTRSVMWTSMCSL